MAKTDILPTSLRLTDEFKQMTVLLMRHRLFNDRTAYIEQLIRDDWDDRATPEMVAEMAMWKANKVTPESKPGKPKRAKSK